MLDEFYFADHRLVLIPVEQLSPAGVAPEFAASLHARCGWPGSWIDLLDEAFALYWQRLTALARRGRDLSPPRLRNVGVVTDPGAVRPFASILNTSTWTLYESDLDPERSDPELVAYLLAHGDRMAETGEVTLAAVHLASWWFERSADERAAFATAAQASPRPDAATYRAIAEALPWLRELRHRHLRPPRTSRAHRPVPGTGLLVPRAVEQRPDQLVGACRAAAAATLEGFHARWRDPGPAAPDMLLSWLASDAPPLLVTARGGGVLWDPDRPGAVGALRPALAVAGAAALHDVAADLRLVAAHTRRFRAALIDPASLPRPDPSTAQSGYAYLHATRGLIAYNLDEPGIERLAGPALPYARAMLGARTIHEWAHLAVDGGLVPRAIDDAAWHGLLATLAGQLDDAIAHAPREIRERCAADVRTLERAGASAGSALAAIFASRLPDYQSNLLGFRFLDVVEREAYVRQNIRPLAREYAPAQLWRLLVRALYEYQYLGFSEVPDRRAYFLANTWFARDFFASAALDEARFDALATAAHTLCAAHVVDESRVRLPANAHFPGG
jgi:hypothetical protein